jgi:hypothetical protein
MRRSNAVRPDIPTLVGSAATDLIKQNIFSKLKISFCDLDSAEGVSLADLFSNPNAEVLREQLYAILDFKQSRENLEFFEDIYLLQQASLSQERMDEEINQLFKKYFSDLDLVITDLSSVSTEDNEYKGDHPLTKQKHENIIQGDATPLNLSQGMLDSIKKLASSRQLKLSDFTSSENNILPAMFDLLVNNIELHDPRLGAAEILMRLSAYANIDKPAMQQELPDAGRRFLSKNPHNEYLKVLAHAQYIINKMHQDFFILLSTPAERFDAQITSSRDLMNIYKQETSKILLAGLEPLDAVQKKLISFEKKGESPYHYSGQLSALLKVLHHVYVPKRDLEKNGQEFKLKR